MPIDLGMTFWLWFESFKNKMCFCSISILMLDTTVILMKLSRTNDVFILSHS